MTPSISSCSMEITSLPPVWLDSLPEEVNNRVIAFLHLVDSDGKLDPDALNLSQISDRQARQVLNSMNDKFFLGDTRSMNLEAAQAWCSIAVPHVRHLWIPEEETPREALRRTSLFMAPNLKGLYTRADAAILNDIAYIPFIRVLDLTGSFASTSLAYHVPLPFKTLSTLHLTVLKLACMSFHSDSKDGNERERCSHYLETCGLEQLLQHDCDPFALGRQCRNVKTLGLICFHESERFALTPFLNGFSNLREFSMDFTPLHIHDGRQISDTLVAKSKTLDSVHLNFVIGGCSRAGEIGAPVKTLRCLPYYRYKLHTPEELDILSRCPNLETLQLFMKPDVDIALPNVTRNFVSLKTLCLAWETNCQHGLQISTDGISRLKRVAEEYHCPAPFTILQTVQLSPKLFQLALFFVKVGVEEVRNILKSMGERPKSLALSIAGQDEPPIERLTIVMEEIARSNRELEVFDLDDVETVLTDDRVRKRCNRSRSGSDGNHQFTVRRIQKAFGIMRRSTPFVD